MDQQGQGRTETRIDGQAEPQPDEERRRPTGPASAVKKDCQPNYLGKSDRRSQNGEAQPRVTAQQRAQASIDDSPVRTGPSPDVWILVTLPTSDRSGARASRWHHLSERRKRGLGPAHTAAGGSRYCRPRQPGS